MHNKYIYTKNTSFSAASGCGVRSNRLIVGFGLVNVKNGNETAGADVTGEELGVVVKADKNDGRATAADAKEVDVPIPLLPAVLLLLVLQVRQLMA